MYIDSHCHLSFPELLGDIERIRLDMARARVVQAVVICTTLEEFPTVHGLALRCPELWSTVGVHPDNEGVREPEVTDLVERAQLPRVVAIGETGLDYYRLAGRSIEQMHWQRERFRVHIRAAKASSRPLVVHTRSAANDTLRILREEGPCDAGGVFHCFTDTLETARGALDLGFDVSFSGIVSFRNAEDLRAVARFVPLERCLIETDSPYLAPVPHRGKTNSPAWVPHVAQVIAQVKNLPLDIVAEATSANARRLFALPVADPKPVLPDLEPPAT
ncbi:MAG: TatD family hydrolase [Burkholderiaceae bacterium]|nr:TatD family hydrolase [Aquabacterium sp.]NUP85242.1 TatD family hydrolase [Burkholderiaceae bacterium]